jgi:hypothetical protein
MSYFDKYTDDKFRDLPDGRSLFYPKGPKGLGYLIPDEQTRTRLERAMKALGFVGAALVFGAGQHIFSRAGVWWHWIPPLLLVPVANWYIARWASEHFQEIYEPYVFGASEERQLDEDSYLKLWAVAIGAVVCVAAGVVIFVQHPAPWVRWAGLGIGLLFGLFVPLALQDIQRKRELDQQQRERNQEWSARSGSRHRFW